MAYNYYQNAAPGWGTSQYQFCRPPVPSFTPATNWGGIDYYRAHSGNADPALYTSLWSRLREYSATGGVGLHEARVWQRRIYSGQTPLSQVLPSDLGAAAAYEAYRTWRYNTHLQDPLNGFPERQREALIALAIAETTRLWQFSGRAYDTYGLRAAAEAAAFTADRIARRVLGGLGGSTGGVGMGGGVAFPSRNNTVDDDPYDETWPTSGRRGRRYSSFGAGNDPYRSGSPYRGASPYRSTSPYPGGGSPYMGAYAGSGNGGIPIPGAPAYGGGSSYGGTPDPFAGAGLPASYGGGGYAGSGSYGGGSPYGAGQPGYGASQVYAGNGITVVQQPSAGYPSSGYATPAYGGGYANAGGYGGGGGYGGAAGYPGTVGGTYGNYGYPNQGSGQAFQAPPGSTIIIHKHKRRNSTSGAHRSRSADGRGAPMVYRV